MVWPLIAAGSNAQETLQPYPPSILHTFLDSRNVYPESVTVDQSSGTFFVDSVKEGTIYKGKIAQPGLEVFSPGGADGRTIVPMRLKCRDLKGGPVPSSIT